MLPARRAPAACAALAAAALLASCRPAPVSGASAAAAPSAAASKAYAGAGVILAFESGGKVVVIHHKAIAGFMDEMTMAYELKDPSQAGGLKVGDAVDFTITAQDDDFVVTALKKK